MAAPLSPGVPAPAFTRPGFDGRPVSLAAYRGKLVLVDFWASWCPPCIVEMPHLMALQKRHAGKLQIIGISMDDDAASAKEVAARFRLNYPNVLGDAALGHSYGGVLGLPQFYLIGRDGKILRGWRGDFNHRQLYAVIEAALR
jgi:cytochrome c biogenesis protein CcmG/thiol:disulfide interchange protein DsbE